MTAILSPSFLFFASPPSTSSLFIYNPSSFTVAFQVRPLPIYPSFLSASPSQGLISPGATTTVDITCSPSEHKNPTLFVLVAPETLVTGSQLPQTYWELRQHDFDVQFLSVTANVDGPLGEDYGALSRTSFTKKPQSLNTPIQNLDHTSNTPNPQNTLPSYNKTEFSLKEVSPKQQPQEKKGLVRFDKSAVHLSTRNRVVNNRDVIWIENLSSKALMFKAMVTNVQEFAIRPCYGVVLKGQKIALDIQMRNGTEKDRILVKVASATTHPAEDMKEFWKRTSPSEVSKFTFHVKLGTDLRDRDKALI